MKTAKLPFDLDAIINKAATKPEYFIFLSSCDIYSTAVYKWFVGPEI
jgi:hypothetical protein